MDNESNRVLAALAELDKPSSGKEVAAAAELDAKVVSNKIKTLKKKGLVDSPVRCKYGITDEGRQEL